MTEIFVTFTLLNDFEKSMIYNEKSEATREKYLRDARSFMHFTAGRAVTKDLLLAYKVDLIEKGYAVRSINSMLASVNSLMHFLGRHDCIVKSIRAQREIYCSEAAELTKIEYMRLLKAAERRPRLYLILQTICGTGIRISELPYFTLEAVREGDVVVNCKNKTRRILIPGKLRQMLLQYAKKNGIRSGVLFRTRNGKPLHRTNIWREMKELCKIAMVSAAKVFPHNLRKLFARTFYARGQDIAKLADILGHSSINTTRIYIMTTGTEHRKRIEELGLVVPAENKKTT